MLPSQTDTVESCFLSYSVLSSHRESASTAGVQPVWYSIKAFFCGWHEVLSAAHLFRLKVAIMYQVQQLSLEPGLARASPALLTNTVAS